MGCLQDSNTNFFHESVMVRQNRNTISVMIESEGNRLSTFSQMAEEAIRYFQNLLGTEDDEIIGCPSIVLAELVNTIPATTQVKPVTQEEIKSTIFAIGREKAPGPDGYTALFFKAA